MTEFEAAVHSAGVSDGGVGRTRQLTGPLGAIVRWASIGLTLYIMLYVGTLFDIAGIQLYGKHRPLVYAGVLFILFMRFPATKSAPRDRVPWYDFVLAALGVAASLYAFGSWDKWAVGVGLPTTYEQALGIALVLVTLEGSRRVLGTAFTIVGLAFLVYPIVGPYLPGILVTRPYTLSGLTQFFYLAGGGSGIFGTAMQIFTTTVAVFLTFGAFLTATGAATVFLDAALGLAGRYRGGMAKVAVISSSFFAMISGVGVANVLVTGSFTIPAMKRMGYRPELAGAIEAAAGTGGILMPPVMGAAAFLMADILSVPYWSIAVAAFIPGLLYYASMFVIVDFEGARDGIKGVPADQIPPLRRTAKRGWFLLVAVAVLLILMGYYGIPVDQSALAAIVVLIVLAVARPGGMRLRAIVVGLEEGGRLLAEIGVSGAVVGIIMSGFALTGLGALLPTALQALAGDNLFVLLVLAAVASIILGMGAPPLLCYVLLAATIAPAIIKYGVLPIGAHMFIFYFGLMSMLTPPVALCAMIASQVAGADFWKTALEACRLGIIAFVVPFFFVYQPVLLFHGRPEELAGAVVSALVGVFALGGALTRYFFNRRIPYWECALLGVGGLLLLYPGTKSDLIGLALLVPSVTLTALSLLRRRRGAIA
jgi:TRAP transporter 4TM/12TM fusion protein